MKKLTETHKKTEDTFGPPAISAKLKKGVFHAVGVSYHDAGKIPSKGISPNQKTGYPDDQDR